MPLLLFPNGRKQYVLRRISTGEIIKRNAAYPTATDDAAIVGLDPDLEYLAMDRDVQPDYDARLFILGTAEEKNELVTPPVWHITYTTAKRTADEIKIAIANAEALENQKAVPPQESLKLFVMGLGILLRASKGLTLTEDEQAVMDRVAEAHADFTRRDKISAEKFAAVDANTLPDIDAWGA